MEIISRLNILQESTESYFKLGQIIVEQEQAGEGRAEYGSKLITNLSKKLTANFGRGYSPSTLKDARQFFLAYQKSQTLSGELSFELSFSHYVQLARLTENERLFYEDLDTKKALSTILLGKCFA